MPQSCNQDVASTLEGYEPRIKNPAARTPCQDAGYKGIAVGCSALSGLVILTHSDDYVSLLVPCFDVLMSLGNLLQWMASIYDRCDLPRFDQPLEEGQILRFV